MSVLDNLWTKSELFLSIFCAFVVIIADHPKSNEYYSDPRLADYAVPHNPVFSSGDSAKDILRKDVETLKTKTHWKKAYLYLWDEPINLEQYDSIRKMSNEICSYALDARVLTTYYSGK
ncbi:hypothetical protein MKX03_033108, partial [Papaver bracteatum]